MRKSNRCKYSALGKDRIRSEEDANIECVHPKKFLHTFFSHVYLSYIEHNKSLSSVNSSRCSLRVGKFCDFSIKHVKEKSISSVFFWLCNTFNHACQSKSDFPLFLSRPLETSKTARVLRRTSTRYDRTTRRAFSSLAFALTSSE